MKNKYVFALGYPIGFNFIDDIEYYNVQLNEDIYPLNLLGAFVWMGALNGGQTKEELFDNVVGQLQVKGYLLDRHYTVEQLENIYYELMDASLLMEVSVDEDINQFFEKANNLKITRKGFGVGVDFNDIIVHEDGKDINLDSFEYYLWQLSVESKTLKETYVQYSKSVTSSIKELGEDVDNFANKVDRSFIVGFVNLYNKNLIYIVGI